jgi:hypothetical protein
MIRRITHIIQHLLIAGYLARTHVMRHQVIDAVVPLITPHIMSHTQATVRRKMGYIPSSPSSCCSSSSSSRSVTVLLLKLRAPLQIGKVVAVVPLARQQLHGAEGPLGPRAPGPPQVLERVDAGAEVADRLRPVRARRPGVDEVDDGS